MTQKPQQRRGLGRGLGSLIPTAPRPEADPDREPLTRGRRRPARCDGPSRRRGARPRGRWSRRRRRAAVDWIGAPAHDATSGTDQAATPLRPEDDGSLRPVAGAYFAELPVDGDQSQPASAAPGLRRGGAGRAGALHPRGRAAPAGRRPPGR